MLQRNPQTGEEITGPADPANPDIETGLTAEEGGVRTTAEGSRLLDGYSPVPGYRMDPGGAGDMSGGDEDSQDTTGYTTGPGRTGTG